MIQHPFVQHSRKAFTVIELLVSISIIAVLVALVTPAVVKANNAAQQVKCLANIRSVGQATAAYVNDHDNRFPLGFDNALNTHNLLGDTGTGAGNLAGAQREAAALLPAEDRLLNAYIGLQPDVASCPLDRGFNTSLSAFESFGTSFVYIDSSLNNPDLSSNNHPSNRLRHMNNVWSLEGHRLNRVDAPSKKVLIGEATLLRSADNVNHHWHNNEANLRGSMAFVDGHVEVVTYKLDREAGQAAQNTDANTLQQWLQQDDYY